MVTNTNTIDKNSLSGIYISCGIFILILTLTIGLFFYNSSLEKKINNLNNEILSVENNIKTIKEDGKINLYTLITNNVSFLDKYKKLSKVTEFITNVDEIGKKFGISFNGFNYDNGDINTKAFIIGDQTILASNKLDNFLKSYRTLNSGTGTENTSIFDLKFVNSFNGQDNIDFNTTFSVK